MDLTCIESHRRDDKLAYGGAAPRGVTIGMKLRKCQSAVGATQMVFNPKIYFGSNRFQVFYEHRFFIEDKGAAPTALGI